MKKFFLTLAVVVAALCCQQLAAQTQINQASIPMFINQPGSYILTSNLNLASNSGSTAIWVNAPNVTINLNGYTITGPCPAGGCNAGTVGIYSPAYNETTVENGQVTGFGYNIYIQSGDIHDMKVTYGNYCIYTFNTIIRHNLVANCGEYGIYAQNSTISDNIVNGATYAGILGYYSSISNNTVNNNSSIGIQAVGGLLSGNTAMHNAANSDFSMSGNAVSAKNNASTNGVY